MSDKPAYAAYAQDDAHMGRYQSYQARYSTKMRESDKILIDWVRSSVPAGAHLLDIGCSTGNLLTHLRHALPESKLSGVDLSEPTVAANVANPALAGIAFAVLDAVKTPLPETYDAITCNAVLFSLDDDEFDRALGNIRRALRPGGYLFAFDWFHPHDDQHLTIVERSREFPGGLRITARPYNRVRRQLEVAGFKTTEFRAFHMPFDLPVPADPADIKTHTAAVVGGDRLSFRGALYQPWCHLRAQ